MKKYSQVKIHPAVISVWAAILAAAHLIPSIPLIGTGGTFSVSTALFPLAGIFFGPVAGALCAAIGGFIGQLIAPHVAWMGMATFMIGTINAFAAGLVSRGKWWGASAIIVLGTILWFTNSIGRAAPIFPAIFYSAGLIASILGGIVALKFLLSRKSFKMAVAIFLCAYTGLVSTATIANYATLNLFGTPAELWKVLAFTSPVERAIFSLGAVAVGLPLMIGLPKIGIFVGPQNTNDQEEDETDRAEEASRTSGGSR